MFNDQVLLIGAGTMGEIFLQAALQLFDSKNITVAQHNAERRAYLSNTYQVTTTELNKLDITLFNIIVLAVKPQDAMPIVAPQALVISVMAGISTHQLQALTGSHRIVRIMPNTPAKLGMGMSVWTTTSTVTKTDQQVVQTWLKKLGQEFYVESDDWIDKATAISGSGPAYLFLFAEQLITAAKQLGFNNIAATTLVSQTLLGASQLLQPATTEYYSAPTPADLRKQVTSKGGTTAAALTSLPQAELQTAWNQAVQAAYNRAKQLSV